MKMYGSISCAEMEKAHGTPTIIIYITCIKVKIFLKKIALSDR